MSTHFYGMVGQTKPMQELYKEIRDAAQKETDVLIIGEGGTGKELVAKAIHVRILLKNVHNVPYFVKEHLKHTLNG